MTQTSTAPAAYDTITAGSGCSARIEYISGSDACLVNPYGDRWSVPTDMLELARPAVRGGRPAEWTVSPAWTAAS